MYNRVFKFDKLDIFYFNELMQEMKDNYLIDDYKIEVDRDYIYLFSDYEGTFKRYLNFFKCKSIHNFELVELEKNL